MSVPANFRAFRIHDDAQGYRSGIEAISLDDLNAR
jgi:acrylyl-CoA reductase (NADPH)